MIKGPGASSTVDETDTPLVLGNEKTGISSPTLSRGANGLGGLPVSLAVAIEVSFSYSGPRSFGCRDVRHANSTYSFLLPPLRLDYLVLAEAPAGNSEWPWDLANRFSNFPRMPDVDPADASRGPAERGF